MGFLAKIKRLIRGTEPTVVDYETYEMQQQSGPSYADTGTDGPLGGGGVLRRVGPGSPGIPASSGTYKMQQSYDSLLETVRDLREALDGQAKRQEELLNRLGTLPHAVEALPQTSKMQSDMLRMINDRLAMHAEQQRKVSDTMASLGSAKKEQGETLQAIRDQIETGNEIDRQLVESFNRFSMMIDRLHIANNHAVECLQQVRDSYAATAMQMQEWVEKSRQRSSWILGGAFFMSLVALVAVIALIWFLANAAH